MEQTNNIDYQFTVSGLTKNYGKKQVLSSISCNYLSGTINGVAGANGAGKTTFFNCITRNTSFEGYIKFPSGKKIGYLPTELYMYPRITGYEFINFCLSAKKVYIRKDEIDLLNTIFDLPLSEYAETYSTGMLKKLYLLVLVLEKDDILILDEPFNGLDISAVSYISELLQRLRKKGKLILVSSHIVDHLYSFCDTLLLIEKGKSTFAGCPDEFAPIKEKLKSEVKEKFDLLGNISDL